MKNLLRKLIKVICLMLLPFGMNVIAFADTNEIGIVMNVEGSFSAKGVDASLRPLSTKSKVLSGDTLFTGKDSYARVKFTDGGQISLRPSSQFKIEKFNYDEKQPGKDAAEFNLLKGALRSISGMIGKRGDPDSYAVKTREATAGIRGTKFGVRLCKGDCGDVPLPADGNPIADGTHFDVLEGTIIVKNPAGSQLLNAGQFGYVGSISAPPIEMPADRAVRVEMPAKISLDNIRGAVSSTTPEISAAIINNQEQKQNKLSEKAKPTDSKATTKEAVPEKSAEPTNAPSTESSAGDSANSGDSSGGTPNTCPK